MGVGIAAAAGCFIIVWVGLWVLRTRRRKRSGQILALDRVELAPLEEDSGIISEMGLKVVRKLIGLSKPRWSTYFPHLG